MSFGLSPHEIKLIQQVFHKHPEIKCVKIFGSRAIGNYKYNSDIDLVLWGNVSELPLAAIHQELEALPLPYQFDVQVYSEISHDGLREHVDICGKAFYVPGSK